METETVFDITEAMQQGERNSNIVKAEAKGANVLILRKLIKPFHPMDKSLCHFQIEYRWLSKPIFSEADVKNENFVCVQGNEFTYWKKKEVQGYETKSLFDMFNLF